MHSDADGISVHVSFGDSRQPKNERVIVVDANNEIKTQIVLTRFLNEVKVKVFIYLLTCRNRESQLWMYLLL